MARVTVEDCVLKVPNRFELVMMAAQRARDLSAGAPMAVEKDNDKFPVIALREIADEAVPLEMLREALVKDRQKHVEAEESEEDIIELMTGEEEFLAQAAATEAMSAETAFESDNDDVLADDADDETDELPDEELPGLDEVESDLAEPVSRADDEV